MTVTIDDYIEQEKKKGEAGNKLAARCVETLKKCPYIEIISQGKNGVVVNRFKEDKIVVVHSAGGDPKLRNISDYSASLVNRLVEQARAIGATPVAMADVIDASNTKKLDVDAIADAMITRALFYNVAIVNGETAGLGSRVNCAFNISGTMISIIDRNSDFAKNAPRSFVHNGVRYAVFDHKCKPVYMNSNGVGTKTEFYERIKKYALAFRDFMAMTLDDAVKLGAIAQVISGVLERKGDIPFKEIVAEISKYGKLAGNRFIQLPEPLCILQEEDVGNRIQSYSSSLPSYNLSGSVVSLIDEDRLKNPPKPSAGEYLIAIRGKPNPRSNGITGKREAMIKMLGDHWHNKSKGEYFMEFLAEPSTLFYPVFQELLQRKAASSFYHMSGDAYDGKLAAPLAKHDLFVKIKDMFKPDDREIELTGTTPNELAYKKGPWGNEGFVTTRYPEDSFRIIEKHCLQARVVGQLQSKFVDDKGIEKTGVELVGIKDSKGKNVYFSGKSA